jgi:hypothetical protein
MCLTCFRGQVVTVLNQTSRHEYVWGVEVAIAAHIRNLDTSQLNAPTHFTTRKEPAVPIA